MAKIQDRLDSFAAAILGAFIALGLIAAGWFVSNTLYKAKFATNTVTVRGFSERDAKADLALWQFSFSVTADTLQQAYAQTETNEKMIVDFLLSKGLKQENIKTGNINVTDLMADQYRNKDVLTGRYIVKNTITVRTADVGMVDNASRELNDLAKQNIVIGSNNVDYQFTKLNDVKTEMLREATQNARTAAQQFANDAGSKVGAIQSASQGYFSVTSRDSQNSDSSEGSSVQQQSTADKKIRVVVTLTYYLDR